MEKRRRICCDNENGKHGEKKLEIKENLFNLLSTDLIHKIFNHVQIKFIARCKSVCKDLNNILSSSEFTDRYPSLTPFTTFVVSHRPLQYDTNPIRYALSFVEISKDGDECTRTNFEPIIPGSWPKQTARLVGSCNGLLCLVLRDYIPDSIEVIYIYNPITGKSVSLPEHRHDNRRRLPDNVSYIFGLGQSDNSLKVLRIDKKWEIFTVGVDHAWRHTKQLSEQLQGTAPVVVNGAVCWLDYPCICVFDLGEEKLCHIAQPRGLVLIRSRMRLAVLNQRLCILDYSHPSCCYTLWTMEEYGVRESWTKTVIVGNSVSSHELLFTAFENGPLAMSRNGNIIYQRLWAGLMSYSPKLKEYTLVEVAQCHKETLVEVAEFCLSPREVIKGVI